MFIPTVGPHSAKIMLVGEAPGEHENNSGKPFVGPAGQILTALLAQAGTSKNECLIANVAREKPPGNNISFYFLDKKMTQPKPILQEWIELLKKEIMDYKPNIVVALGATALWALCDLKGIKAYRGYLMESSLVPGQKVLPTYHPQKVSYEWNLAFTVIMDLRKAVANSGTREIPKDTRQLNAYPTPQEFLDYLDFLLNDHKDLIALDLETTMPGCHVTILGIADSPNHALSFTFISGRQPRLSVDKELEVWEKVAEVLSKKQIIMHNGLYDMAVLWRHLGILTKHYIHDTMVAGHVCWPEAPRSLSFLSSICLNVSAWKHTSQSMPSLYNAEDAVNTYAVWEVMKEEIEKLDEWNTYKFEMEQVWPATMMQLQGLRVDIKRQEQIKRNISLRQSQLEKELDQSFGKPVNLRSPKQLSNLLYIDMGLPVQYKRRKSKFDQRKVTTDSEALEKLSRITDNPLLDKILEAKKLDKLLNTFIDIEVSPKGRVHTSYNITGATMLRNKKGLLIDDEDSYKSFGRWSSSKSIILPYGSGNHQNIPKAARVIYIAPPKKVFLQADYIQAEAVVVAYCSGDEPVKKMFQEAFGLSRKERAEEYLDIHLHTASTNFKIPLDQVTREQREIGKTLRHATNYSAGPGVVAAELGCSMTEAKALLKQHHESCPQLRVWHSRIQDELRRTKSLTNLLGRKHRFTERWGDQLFRGAYSYIPQSTVADLLNLALVKIYNTYGGKLEIALQLHDAIYFIIEEERVDWTIRAVKELMLMPLEVNREKFIIDVDFAVGASWGELEEI